MERSSPFREEEARQKEARDKARRGGGAASELWPPCGRCPAVGPRAGAEPLAKPWTGRLSIEYVRCRPSRVFGFTAATSSRCGLWTPPALRCALGGPDARCVRAVGCHGGGGDGLAAGCRGGCLRGLGPRFQVGGRARAGHRRSVGVLEFLGIAEGTVALEEPGRDQGGGDGGDQHRCGDLHRGHVHVLLEAGVGGGDDRRCDDRIAGRGARDRKSTRLNSSHVAISYAVVSLRKKIIILGGMIKPKTPAG